MIRTAGTAAGAGHTRGPGGVGPMREIISKGFAHVLSISPYHLPSPALLCPFVPPDTPLVMHPPTLFPRPTFVPIGTPQRVCVVWNFGHNTENW